MMEDLIKQMKRAPIPHNKLQKLFKNVLDVQEKKGTLPWVNLTKKLFNRVAESKSKIFFNNAKRLLRCNLLKTLNKGLKVSKASCQKYSKILGSLVSYIHYAFDDKDFPVEDVQTLTSCLFATVIDLTVISVEENQEADVQSRIYMKLTLMLGSSPNLVLDVLLQCRTLLYSSIRNSLVFEPLIRQLFNTFKIQSADPELYLKYLLLGKLLLFMTEKTKIPETRMYVIKLLPMPHSLNKWGQQNNVTWLTEKDKNTTLILKRMTVSEVLNTIYKRTTKVKAVKQNVHKGSAELVKASLTKDEKVNRKKKDSKIKEVKSNLEKVQKAKETANLAMNISKKNKKSFSNVCEEVKIVKMENQEKEARSVLIKDEVKKGNMNLEADGTKKNKKNSGKEVKNSKLSSQEMEVDIVKSDVNETRVNHIEVNVPEKDKSLAKQGKERKILKQDGHKTEGKDIVDGTCKNTTINKRKSLGEHKNKLVKTIKVDSVRDEVLTDDKLTEKTKKGSANGGEYSVTPVKTVDHSEVLQNSQKRLENGTPKVRNEVSVSPSLTPNRDFTTPKRSIKDAYIIESPSQKHNKKLKTPPACEIETLKEQEIDIGDSPSGRSKLSPRDRRVSISKEDLIELHHKIRRSSIEFVVTDLAPEYENTPPKCRSPQVNTPNTSRMKSVQSPRWMSFDVSEIPNNTQKTPNAESDAASQFVVTAVDDNAVASEVEEQASLNVNVDDNSNSDGDIEVVEVIDTDNEQKDEELDTTRNMELLMETIARDSGRITTSGHTDKDIGESKELLLEARKLESMESHTLSNGHVEANECEVVFNAIDGSPDSEKENAERVMQSPVKCSIPSQIPRQLLTVNNNEVIGSDDVESSKAIYMETSEETPDNINGSAEDESHRMESPDLEPLVLDIASPGEPTVPKENDALLGKIDYDDALPASVGEGSLDSKENDSESTEGADEAYEASSDASEVPVPRVRKRTRSLRRSLLSQPVPQDASDSDVSPKRLSRYRGASEAETNIVKEYSHRQRTRSLGLEMMKSDPDTSKPTRRSSRLSTGSVISKKIDNGNFNSLTDVQCDIDLKTSSDSDSVWLLLRGEYSTGSLDNSDDVSFVKGLHSMSSTPIVSVAGTPVKDDIEQISTRSSPRLAATVNHDSSKYKRRSMPSGKMSDNTESTKTLGVRALTRNASRKSVSDSEVHKESVHLDRSLQSKPSLDHENGNVPKHSEVLSSTDSLSLEFDDDLASGLPSSPEQIPFSPLNYNPREMLEKTEDTCKLGDVILAKNAADGMECDIVVEENTPSIVKESETDTEVNNTSDLKEGGTTTITTEQKLIEKLIVAQCEEETCPPAAVDEELEVLSTSGVEESEDLGSSSPSKGGKQQKPESVTTPGSHVRLRSLTHRRSGGKVFRKEDSFLSSKLEPSSGSPKLKAHLVSDAMLNKEIIISPEVSDEECELVSPGVSEADSAKDFSLQCEPEFSPSIRKNTHSGTPVSRRTKRKSGSGIRSPEKVIPEEQDESPSVMDKASRLPKARVQLKHLSKLDSEESIHVVSCASPVQEEAIKSPMKKAEEMSAHKFPTVEVKTMPDMDSVSHDKTTSVVKESEQMSSLLDIETSPVRVRRSRRLSAAGTPEIKPLDSGPLRRTRRLSMTQKKEELNQELAVPFSPRRSSRRKSIASSSVTTEYGNMLSVHSSINSASSSGDKCPQISEEDEIVCKDKSLESTILDSPRPRNQRTSVLRQEIPTRSSPQTSSPARSTRSLVTSKNITPVRTSSRLFSRIKEEESSCEKNPLCEISDTSSTESYHSVNSEESTVSSGHKMAASNVCSDFVNSPVVHVKSPVRSTRLKSPPSLPSGDESFPRSPIRLSSRRSSLENRVPERVSSPSKPPLKYDSDNTILEKKTPAKSPNVIKSPIKSPVSSPNLNKTQKSASKMSLRSPPPGVMDSLKKTPVSSPDNNKWSLRSASPDKVRLKSNSATDTPTRASTSSAVCQSPRASGRLALKMNTPSRVTADDRSDSNLDVEPVVTTRRLRSRQVTYKADTS